MPPSTGSPQAPNEAADYTARSRRLARAAFRGTLEAPLGCHECRYGPTEPTPARGRKDKPGKLGDRVLQGNAQDFEDIQF